ncbi:hypothetical protein [Brachyspira hampsonii]|uniref:Uncharacterized protein n=1 Tax=Brachyspira hampsonii TaxID=1287055 RepID=A0AAC9TSI5_9SPIR|nr:hypothetical protein [Brachyspira hampsonii]ASJ21153.1 hypothetical protein BHAMNSH16_05615 [Brachyspira hampsonii]ELV05225.1 hypothetical protein H263_11537 [Brachyspira hampsonii 30599]OEJ16760.1 hypothetical protein A9496_00325 [Brachyspira hampsonii]
MRNRKYREENIYIRAILVIISTMAILIGLILFVINSPAILNKYDVVNNKSETIAKYSKKYDLTNEKYDLLNLVIHSIYPRRLHYGRFEWIPESLFFRVTIMFLLSFSSSLFGILAVHKIKKEGLKNKKELIINFLPLLWILITIFAFLMLKDNIINAKEYLSIAAGIILGLLLANYKYKY